MICFYYQNQECKINPARRPEILNFDRVFPVLLSVEYYFFAFWTGWFFHRGVTPSFACTPLRGEKLLEAEESCSRTQNKDPVRACN